MAASKATKTLTFTLNRETKNTIRYQEDAPDGVESIGTLYIQKHAARDLGAPNGFPQAITVTLTAGQTL